MKRILYALSHHKFHFVCVRLLGLALKAIFALADPLVMKLLIDEGLIKRNLRLFGLFAALVVLFGAAARVRPTLARLPPKRTYYMKMIFS